MLSPARFLAPAAAATAVAASLLFMAQLPANAATCTTAPGVNSPAPTYNSSTGLYTLTVKITSNACDNGVEADLVTNPDGAGKVAHYGGDVKGVGDTSSVSGTGTLIANGYRYWANKTGTAQWYYVPPSLSGY